MIARPPIDDSDPGAWRAALQPNGACAVCRQLTCDHSDAEYAGLARSSPPARQEKRDD